jgi:hypothetical protein
MIKKVRKLRVSEVKRWLEITQKKSAWLICLRCQQGLAVNRKKFCFYIHDEEGFICEDCIEKEKEKWKQKGLDWEIVWIE